MELNFEKVKESQELKRLEELKECCGVKVKRFYIDAHDNLIKYTPTIDEFICKDEDAKKLYFARDKVIIAVRYDETVKPDIDEHIDPPFPIGTFELVEENNMYRYDMEYTILLKYLNGEITKEKVSLVLDLDSIKEVDVNESVEE